MFHSHSRRVSASLCPRVSPPPPVSCCPVERSEIPRHFGTAPAEPSEVPTQIGTRVKSVLASAKPKAKPGPFVALSLCRFVAPLASRTSKRQNKRMFSCRFKDYSNNASTLFLATKNLEFPNEPDSQSRGGPAMTGLTNGLRQQEVDKNTVTHSRITAALSARRSNTTRRIMRRLIHPELVEAIGRLYHGDRPKRRAGPASSIGQALDKRNPQAGDAFPKPGRRRLIRL
jgi:hypothetical protein